MLKWNGEIVAQNHFPDGTLKLITGMPYYIPESGKPITWQYESDAELFSLICLVKHIHRCFPGLTPSLEMPYLPHARMDRVKDDSDVFTLKYFAEVINSLQFKSVRILDPHSNVGPALLNNARVLSPVSYIQYAINDINRPDLILFYPDEGACKRYSGMLFRPSLFGIKQRDAAVSDLKRAEEFAAVMQSQLDTEVHPECDYGLYCTLCDALSDITLWQHKDIWWGDRDQMLHDPNNEKGTSTNDQA